MVVIGYVLSIKYGAWNMGHGAWRKAESVKENREHTCIYKQNESTHSLFQSASLHHGILA